MVSCSRVSGGNVSVFALPMWESINVSPGFSGIYTSTSNLIVAKVNSLYTSGGERVRSGVPAGAVFYFGGTAVFFVMLSFCCFFARCFFVRASLRSVLSFKVFVRVSMVLVCSSKMVFCNVVDGLLTYCIMRSVEGDYVIERVRFGDWFYLRENKVSVM